MIELNKVEDEIIRLLVTQLLNAGYVISVDDGEEITVVRSDDIGLITESMKTTDEDYLYCHTETGLYRGFVRLVYGNCEWEVICDYSDTLEGVISDAVRFSGDACDFYG